MRKIIETLIGDDDEGETIFEERRRMTPEPTVVVVKRAKKKGKGTLNELDKEALKKLIGELHDPIEPTPEEMFEFQSKAYPEYDKEGKAKDPVVREVDEIEDLDAEHKQSIRDVGKKRYMLQPEVKVDNLEKLTKGLMDFANKLDFIGEPSFKEEDVKKVRSFGEKFNQKRAEEAADEEEAMWMPDKTLGDYEPLPEIEGDIIQKAQYAAKRMLFSDKVSPKIKTALSRALEKGDEDTLISLTNGYLMASRRLEMLKDRQELAGDKKFPDDPLYYLEED